MVDCGVEQIVCWVKVVEGDGSMVVVFFCVVEQGCSEGIVFIEVVIGVYLQIVVKFVLVLVGFVGEEVGQFVIFKKVLCCIVIVWCLLVIQFEVGEKVECLFVVVEVVGGVVIGRLFGCEAKGVVEVFFFFFFEDDVNDIGFFFGFVLGGRVGDDFYLFDYVVLYVL